VVVLLRTLVVIPLLLLGAGIFLPVAVGIHARYCFGNDILRLLTRRYAGTMSTSSSGENSLHES